MPEIHSGDGNGRHSDQDLGAAAALIAEAEAIIPGPSSGVMTIVEVARWMRVNPATVYRLAMRNAIPHFRAGRTFRFRRDELDVWSRTNHPYIPQGRPLKSALPRRRVAAKG